MKLNEITQYLTTELPINVLVGVAKSGVEFDFTGIELDTPFTKQLDNLIDNNNEGMLRSFIKAVVNDNDVVEFLKVKMDDYESNTFHKVFESLRIPSVDLTDCQDEIFQLIQQLDLKKLAVLEKYTYLIDLAKLLDISIVTIKEGT